MDETTKTTKNPIVFTSQDRSLSIFDCGHCNMYRDRDSLGVDFTGYSIDNGFYSITPIITWYFNQVLSILLQLNLSPKMAQKADPINPEDYCSTCPAKETGDCTGMKNKGGDHDIGLLIVSIPHKEV